jgi:hypothetical protein
MVMLMVMPVVMMMLMVMLMVMPVVVMVVMAVSGFLFHTVHGHLHMRAGDSAFHSGFGSHLHAGQSIDDHDYRHP